jgi:hypothetical protein
MLVGGISSLHEPQGIREVFFGVVRALNVPRDLHASLSAYHFKGAVITSLAAC